MPKPIFTFLFTTFRTNCEIKSRYFFLLLLNSNAFDSIVPFAFMFSTQKSSSTSVFGYRGQEKFIKNEEKERDGYSITRTHLSHRFYFAELQE